MKTSLPNSFRLQPQDKPSQPQPQSEYAAPGATTGAVAFQGNIAAIALENIFQLFDFAALSGRLEVQATNNNGSFYFKQGALIYGMLQISRRKIGEILLESHMITAQQLQECLSLQEQMRPQRPFGQILLEKGYIDPVGLDETLLRQIKEAFFETLSWQEGTFVFYHNQAPTPEAIQLKARVDHLLLEGMVYLDDMASPEP